jgi:hypothetical protein
MTESPLKSVFRLDSDTQTYKPVAHNISAAQAIEQTGTHRTAKIVDQEKRHRNPDPTKCKACKKVAEELTTKHTESAGAGADEELASAQESESD